MQINRKPFPEATIEAFAEKHALVMDVEERAMDKWQVQRGLKRYVAHFHRAEVRYGAMLEGAYGEGDTEAEAIADYAQRISLQVLLIDAWGVDRRELQVPRLVAS